MKGNKTVEADVVPAPGGMFKGVIRVTTTRGTKTHRQVIGRGCGRPMPTADAAMELTEIEVRRMLAL